MDLSIGHRLPQKINQLEMWIALFQRDCIKRVSTVSLDFACLLRLTPVWVFNLKFIGINWMKNLNDDENLVRLSHICAAWLKPSASRTLSSDWAKNKTRGIFINSFSSVVPFFLLFLPSTSRSAACPNSTESNCAFFFLVFPCPYIKSYYKHNNLSEGVQSRLCVLCIRNLHSESQIIIFNKR